MSAALDGLRVLDLADEKGLPCTKFLADAGADVVKIEPPGGDATRKREPFAGDDPGPERSLYFLHHNANKRGVTLDLATAEGQDLFRQLAKTADVVVETFSPGTMEGWGLGYEALAALNPKIVVASITLFGQTGPFKDYQGGELVAFALGGLMSMSGEPGGPPVVAPGELSCGIASMHAALAIQVALWHRLKTGRGQHIDVSLAEAATHAGSYVTPRYSYLKEKQERITHLGHCPELHHDLYRCKDGLARLFILSRDHWRTFVDWLGKPEELTDPAFERPHHRAQHMDQISPHVDRFVAGFTKNELYMEGQGRHLAVTPVNTPKEFVESDQTKARGFFQEVDHPVVGRYPQVGALHKYSAVDTAVRRPAPLLGQHNDEVYRSELGLDAGNLEALRAKGVI
jgi:crotonobetainyl-CoA:carnitine CoA-transferase CaiB-like acyl-CoA transferase